MVVGQPAEFRFLSSTVRKEDPPGTLVEHWPTGEIEELAAISTAMEGEPDKSGAPIPVTLHARISEVGTLDLQLRSRDGQRWKLEFNLRDA